MRRLLLLLLLLGVVRCLPAREHRDTLRFRAVAYNVENLFDTQDDSLKDDAEFLPDGVRRWNYRKYRKKLDDVARVITAVGGWTPPALVALCEVENDTVLRDLTRYSLLREAGYRYILTDSEDQRGIDVALLYQRGVFRPLSHRSLRILPPASRERPTRDILHVSGLLLNGDTLDIFVCHFPSRSGGAKETEPYRLQAAQQLRSAVDSLLQVRHRPQLLLMGDFNDNPGDKPMRLLQDGHTLHHLFARRAVADSSFGSYKYRGEWGLFDHLLVSANLLQPDAPLHTSDAAAHVFCAPFLLTDDPQYGGQQPFRTYHGMRYRGGYSDHLPVWVEFRLLY